MYDFSDIKELLNKRKYEDRKNFVWLGNFQHHPNMDAFRMLIDHIWPKIN
jgi:hypothetical protein